MRSKMFRLGCLVACLAIAIPVLAAQQRTDPLTGTWTGDWGPSAADRNTVNVELKLDGTTVTGVVRSINPERPDVMLQKSRFDSATGAVHMEAEAPNPRGGRYRPIHYVINGKLA